MNFSGLVVVQLLVAVVCFGFAFYFSRRIKAVSATSAVLLLAFMGIWALAAGMEMAVSAFAAKRFMLGMSYVGVVFLPPTWMCFMAEYIFHRRQHKNPLFVVLFSLSGALLLSNWLNPFDLFYTSVDLAVMDGLAYILPGYGPLFWALMALNYGGLLSMMIWLWAISFKGRANRRHLLLMSFGVAAPIMCNLFYMLRIISYDITSLGFVGSVIVLFFLHKSEFFSALPISRNYLFDALGDGILLVNSRDEVVDLNAAAISMLALAGNREDMIRSATALAFVWRQEAETSSDVNRLMHNFNHPALGPRHYRVSRNLLASQQGAAARSYVMLIQDETDLYHARERIRFLENYDSVTGLMGRQFFTRLLAQEIEMCGSLPQSNAVICTSIVNYSDFCNIYGSDFGEALQREVGIRIQSMLRQYDAISRFSEDEFYLCFRYDNAAGDAVQNTARVMDRLSALFDTPLQVGGRNIAIRLRCGAAFCPYHSNSADKLITMAKMAQLHSSRASKQLYCCYREEMGQDMSRYLLLEQCLHKALEKGEMRVVYHPQVDLATGRVCGAEALIRWESPELGSVPPSEFISVAEESGEIKKLGMWVIRQAIAQAARWQEEGLPEVRMSVNVSLGQLIDADFADRVIAAVKESGLSPRLLEVEITESMAMSPEVLNFGHLPRLREHGIRLAMDDFGMGHSSLNYLKQFTLDTIKIDRVLSQDMLFNPTSVAMIKSVQLLCHSLGMDTVVEFIEHQEQLDLLVEIGCNIVQGYVFSPPLDAEECTAFIRRSMDERLFESQGVQVHATARAD